MQSDFIPRIVVDSSGMKQGGMCSPIVVAVGTKKSLLSVHTHDCFQPVVLQQMPDVNLPNLNVRTMGSSFPPGSQHHVIDTIGPFPMSFSQKTDEEIVPLVRQSFHRMASRDGSGARPSDMLKGCIRLDVANRTMPYFVGCHSRNV